MHISRDFFAPARTTLADGSNLHGRADSAHDDDAARKAPLAYWSSWWALMGYCWKTVVCGRSAEVRLAGLTGGRETQSEADDETR